MISCSNSWLPVTAMVKFWTWFIKGVSNGYLWPISFVINIGKLWPILNCELGSGRSEIRILSPWSGSEIFENPSPSHGFHDFSNFSWSTRFHPWIPGSDIIDTLPIHYRYIQSEAGENETSVKPVLVLSCFDFRFYFRTFRIMRVLGKVWEVEFFGGN